MRFTVILTIALISTFATASDLANEKRWAAQIENALLDGEPVYLNDGKQDFLAIDTVPEKSGKTGVIMLHGMGVHPDLPQVIYPLRTRLAENGWRTLSLKLPILRNEATDGDYAPRQKKPHPAFLLAAII